MSRKSLLRRSVIIPIVFLVYSTVCYVLLIPDNVTVTIPEMILTFLANLLVVALLAVVLRKKEHLQQEREADMAAADEELPTESKEETKE